MIICVYSLLNIVMEGPASKISQFLSFLKRIMGCRHDRTFKTFCFRLHILSLYDLYSVISAE